MNSPIEPAAWWRSPARAVAVCGALTLFLFGYASLGGRYAFSGTPVTTRPAPFLNLTSDDGKPFALDSLRGRAVLVYFGYTHCPNVCPTTLADLAPVFALLGAEAAKVRVVFVTLDPRRDTPSVLHDYLSTFDPAPIGLTGSVQDVANAASDWNVTWRPAENGSFFDHTSVTTLIDPQGRLRVRYGVGQMDNVMGIAQDIRHVLDAG